MMVHVVIGKIWHPFLDSPRRLHSLGSVDATPRAIYAASVRQLQDLILCYRTGYPDVLFNSAASAALAMLVGALLRDVPVPPAMPPTPMATPTTTAGRRAESIFPPAAIAAQREQQHRLKQRQYEQALIIWRSYFLLCVRCWQDMYTCYPIFRDVVRAHLAQALQGNALSPAEVRRHVAELDQRGAHHHVSSSSTQDRQQEQQQQRQGQHETRGQDIGSSVTTPARSAKQTEAAEVVKTPGTIKDNRTTTELGSRHHVAALDKSVEAAVDGEARGAQRQAETQPQLHEAAETANVLEGQDRTENSEIADGAGRDAPADTPHGTNGDNDKETQASTIIVAPPVPKKAPPLENTGTFVSDFDKSSVARDGRSGGVWMHTMAAQLDELTLFAEFTNNEDLETRAV